MDRIDVAQDRGSLWAVANAVTNLRHTKLERKSGLAEDLLNSQERL